MRLPSGPYLLRAEHINQVHNDATNECRAIDFGSDERKGLIINYNTPINYFLYQITLSVITSLNHKLISTTHYQLPLNRSKRPSSTNNFCVRKYKSNLWRAKNKKINHRIKKKYCFNGQTKAKPLSITYANPINVRVSNKL